MSGRHKKTDYYQSTLKFFCIPDYTVGHGITPCQPLNVGRGLVVKTTHRRSGITPCPEDIKLIDINYHKLAI